MGGEGAAVPPWKIIFNEWFLTRWRVTQKNKDMRLPGGGARFVSAVLYNFDVGEKKVS